MRTLALLAALAAVATAVPALPGYNYGYRPAQYRLPAHYRREKKSPQTLTDPAPIDIAIDTSLDALPEARTIALKKPIIIKKKFGYHLYRDSDEEQAHADPRERCNKEVKVKLCDAEHMARSSDNARAAEETGKHENDMETSIKLAKEAVENLQKMTKFQNARLGADDVHEDIEVARQALEHIQQNFGNLETMNVHAATLTEAEALKNAQFAIANNENERMAQWKEAINNIQKNAEIARNIEDSFKSSNLMDGAITDDSVTIEKAKSSASEQKGNLESLAQVKASDKQVDDPKFKTLLKNVEEQHDVASAASEFKESKVEETSGNPHTKAEEKTTEKAASDGHSKNAENEQPKAVDHMTEDQAPAASAPVMTSVSFIKDSEARASHQWISNAKDTEGEKSTWEKAASNKIVAKASEHIPEDAKKMDLSEMKHEKVSEVDSTLLMKSSESEVLQKVDELKMKEKDAEQSLNLAINNIPNEHIAISKSNDGTDGKKEQDMSETPVPSLPKEVENKEEDTHMKSADLSSVNLKLSTDMHPALDSQLKEQNTEMKSALIEVPVTEEKEAHSKAALMETSASEHMEVSLKGQQGVTGNNQQVLQMKAANNAAVDSHKTLDGSSKTVGQLHQKSADMETAPSNQVEAQVPPFFPFKSADHPEMSAVMKVAEADGHVPPFFPFKSAEHPDMKAALKTADSDTQIPPFFPFKSAEHPDMKAAMKTADLDTQIPPFFPFKSAEHQELKTALKAADTDAEKLPSIPFKSAERQELKASLKAAESDAERPPFFPFKSAEHQELKATDSDAEIPPFFPFKSADHQELKATELDAERPPFFPFKSTEHQAITAAMRASDMKKMQEQTEFQVEGKNWHMDKLNQKTTDVDFERTPTHSHSPMFTSPAGEHFVGSHAHGHEVMRQRLHHGPSMDFHHKSMGHKFKAAEVDSAVQATSQVMVNDAAGKAAMEHNNLMQWKQKEAARGAYGAYGAPAVAGAGLGVGAGVGGPGALGVFPGAKVGGCAIPLLLSCSPNVVSGSLAAPSYSAPHAYRSTNDFSGRQFPIKRDTKKTSDISIKVKRTPSKVIQKIPLDKKL